MWKEAAWGLRWTVFQQRDHADQKSDNTWFRQWVDEAGEMIINQMVE